jgi:hypothetical protein
MCQPPAWRGGPILPVMSILEAIVQLMLILIPIPLFVLLAQKREQP